MKNNHHSPFSIVHSPLPKGYKKTEVGVIPEDWEVKRIGDFTDCTAGGTPSTSNPKYWGGDILWMSSGELHQKFVYDVEGRITDEGLKNSSTKIIPGNCVLVGLAGQGKTRGTVAMNRVPLCTNQSIAAIFPNERFVAEYLYYNLENRYLELRSLSTGDGGRGGLNLRIIRNILVPLPPLPEQRAIAAALGDVDALLAVLDALIAKKRAVKQAAMQALLTGRVRLPGFSGEWEKVVLGNHVRFLKTGSYSRAQLTKNGPVKYLHYGDVHAAIAVWLDAKETPMPGISEEQAANLDLLQCGDVVFVDASEDLVGVGKSVEITDVPEGGLVAGLHTIAARFDKNILADGFKGYLQFTPDFRKQLLRFAAGTKVYAIQRAHIAAIEINLPDVDEQRAIAAVLSDMDAEIAALEARREKVRQVKQGMMQVLLTGKVRLV